MILKPDIAACLDNNAETSIMDDSANLQIGILFFFLKLSLKSAILECSLEDIFKRKTRLVP